MAIQTHNLFFNQSPFINTQFTPIPISSFTKFTLNSSRIRPTFIQSSKQDTGSVLDHIEKTNKTHKEDKDKDQVSMTIGPVVQVSGRSLVVKDRIILSGVSENVVTSSGCESGQTDGGFIGAVFEEEGSRHVASLGRLNGVRFMACFRFKLWWMAQKMGDKGSEVPNETQFLLMETVEEREKMYVVFLPLVEGSFRACLQGSCSGDELEVCVESGDVDIKGSIFSHTVYVGVGTDPFSTVTDAINKVKLHLKSFKQRQDKKLPGIVDCFGWCTWDAFYQDVTQEGVESGLKSLADGGTPAKFVIIDDGWQSVGSDDKKIEESEESEESKESQPLMRLTGIKENEKFQSEDDPALGIKNIVNIAKNTYGLKYVYVWHAIVGYWGGVRPEADGMEEYGSSMKYPKASKGVVANDPVWKTDMLAVQGLGLMDPKKVFKFYDNLHQYLAAAGVDGVKVDVQCILETLGSGLGGRVALTQQYHQALDASIARNFPDNGCIACMSHNTDALYCSQQTAVVRASDDFYPRDPVSHTIHIASVAFNSVFLGEFMQPDWDMFHSLHPAAEYHASARAISGGPIYVSDAPGKHNFDLLKKLVLPDGSVLRARLPGRPTNDCLFSDPTRDGVSLLKIWNMNKYTGVIGVYNCQGAAWNTNERKNTFHETHPGAITGAIRAHDVHLIADAAVGPDWSGDCVMYRHHTQDVIVLPRDASIPLSLHVLEHEVFTVTPIKVLGSGLSFGPLGLIDMFNSGGAVDGLEYSVEGGLVVVSMMVKGCGRFGAYSKTKPKRCVVGPSEVEFAYDSDSGLVVVGLSHMPEEHKCHHIKIHL
ncbi:putative galactinol--sucrose galactosyltransferase [Helianthus annuus]|nr:putative galactinol--sucrose galactosyltransferase [Helianthus annuus]KAJ0885526.1 putative galactinol--sucrose galactosyltransferase [Helianthus annuus]